MPGYSLIGRVATFASSSVTCPEKPGSTKPAVAWVSRPSRPSDDLPSTRAAMSSGRVHTSYVDPRTNSPGCRMNGSSPSGSTIRVRSDWSAAGSMCGYLWFSKTRKNRSSRTSMDDGWSIAGSQGSIAIRPSSIWARMSRSDSSTVRPYRWPRPTHPDNGTVSLQRYVAIGDSFTEGVGDPDPDRPNGLRGWADRVAEVLSGQVDDFGYANLATRGRKLDGILAEQVEPALTLRPDLLTVYAGANDILRPRVDLDALVAKYDDALGRLASSGARLLVWTAFDPGGSAIYRAVRGRFALYNELVRE